MKNKIGLLTLLTCALSSCGISDTGPVRIYAPFGSMSAIQVENACKTYANRIGRPLDAGYVYLVNELAVFDNVYVDMLKFDVGSLGMGVPCVCVNVVLNGTYICYCPDPSYSVNVYVDGDASYSLESAYTKGIINDENVQSIIYGAERCHLRYGWPEDVTPETFSFSLKWGCGPEHSYNSKTGVLVKDLYPHSSGLTKEDYTTTYDYPNIEELYQKTKQLDLYSYPTEYDAYEGTLERTNPAYTYRLEIGDKVINATNCPVTERLPEGLTPKGRSFLTLVFEIIDTIQNSDEWKSLPEQTPRYK